jgi:tetratricopeptide (TPR) repeat protein
VRRCVSAPHDAALHYSLGRALAKKRNLASAIAEYREALRLKADLARVHYSLGAALARKRDIAGAMGEYVEASLQSLWGKLLAQYFSLFVATVFLGYALGLVSFSHPMQHLLRLVTFPIAIMLFVYSYKWFFETKTG